MKISWWCFLVGIVFSSCSFQPRASWVVTTELSSWQTQPELISAKADTVKHVDVSIFPDVKKQEIAGFGATLNETDWICLSRLNPSIRENIMEELFFPDYGGSFSLCILPIGANDYAKDWYSYDETDEDFELDNFTISNDQQTLVPFIKTALRYSSDIQFIAVPWSAPTWMKSNKTYSTVSDNLEEEAHLKKQNTHNILSSPTKDLLIQDSVYLDAYAAYFLKYLKAYNDQGIEIFGVMPQYVWNKNVAYPGMLWTTNSLDNFIGDYLGPSLKDEKTNIIYGTMNILEPKIVEAVMHDSICNSYIKGLAFQNSTPQNLREISEAYPDMPLYMTDQGNEYATNSWKDATLLWNKLFYSFSNGLSGYTYPNIALEKASINKWGQKRNSLVVVDSHTDSYNYTSEYFIIRHFSHYIRPGAVRLATMGEFIKILAFQNPDDTIAIILSNDTDKDKTVSIKIDKRVYQPLLPANSLSTIYLD